MASLDQVLDEAMDLPLEQQEMLLQILQRRPNGIFARSFREGLI